MSYVPIAPRRRLWPVFIMPVAVVIAAIAWSAFWFFTASQVDQKLDQWRTREALSGRSYDCANRSVAGFPFRLEVRCDNVAVSLNAQTPGREGRSTLTARLRDILVVTQIYDPRLLIAEITGPATVADAGEKQPFAIANWSTARISAAGLPALPQRVSMVFENPAIDGIASGNQSILFRAKHLELHHRQAEGATGDRPVIEAAWQTEAATLPSLHPLLAEPFNADIRARVSGLTNFAPKSWPERFREIQAGGGKIELTGSRVQQGDSVAVAAGSLGISASGHLDGELQVTVAGLEKIVPALGIDKLLAENVPQSTIDRVAPGVNVQDVNKVIGALDRMIPGLGNIARQNANAGVTAGLNLLGQPTTLEGKKARAFPLRFSEGAIFIGPLKVGQTPALF